MSWTRGLSFLPSPVAHEPVFHYSRRPRRQYFRTERERTNVAVGRRRPLCCTKPHQLDGVVLFPEEPGRPLAAAQRTGSIVRKKFQEITTVGRRPGCSTGEKRSNGRLRVTIARRPLVARYHDRARAAQQFGRDWTSHGRSDRRGSTSTIMPVFRLSRYRRSAETGKRTTSFS